ncbi:broad-complex core protein isoforms 1/2/3/4/5-like isoform X2 [Photinus pyralis]|nr:broad-complex core protein isoforms 1/2/3/4/5-like isoform X2 [Photinus pyralis]
MSVVDDQQFCLRWNNFQANITSQFETLRDDEDFTDVTIACEGQQLQAHKIILSACSPLFKELFKSNPCPHPIIFMRDVEAQHIVALMEFMYAGEVNVAQAQLSAFLKTAESLKIRGLTDTSNDLQSNKEENMVFLNPQPSNVKSRLTKTKISSCSSTVTSSQDINPSSPPPTKKACQMGKNNVQLIRDQDASFEIETHINLDERNVAPKVELPEYLSDDDGKEDGCSNFNSIGDITELTGGMEIIPTHSSFNAGQNQTEGYSGIDSRKLHSLDPRPCQECGRVYSNLSNLRQHMKLIHNPTYVECYICKKSFKTDLYLKRHIMSSHDSNRCALKRELSEGKWYQIKEQHL